MLRNTFGDALLRGDPGRSLSLADLIGPVRIDIAYAAP